MRTDPSKGVGGVPSSQSPSAKRDLRALAYQSEEAKEVAQIGVEGAARYFSSKEIRPFKRHTEVRHGATRPEQKIKEATQKIFTANKKHFAG